MAEEREDRSREDLTEEASLFRLEEFRRKGMVAQSRELTGLLALLAAGIAVYVLAPGIAAQIVEFMREVFRADMATRADAVGGKAMGTALGKAFLLILALTLPACAIGFAIGAISSFAQIGAIFSWDPVQPDLKKLDPIQGLQRMFTLRHLVEGVRLVAKASVLGILAYVLVKDEILGSPRRVLSDPTILISAFSSTSRVIFLSLLLVLTGFALWDFWIQRREYQTNLRLTKQEAKQEHKEREGDPQIKARVRAVQREMARRRMMNAVKKADVVVTNPTHFAVAIAYEKERMAAPKIVAKGADFLAQRIKKIALDSGVPLVENPPLARTLYRSVKVGALVPRALYQAVAEVLAYVYRLKGKMNV